MQALNEEEIQLPPKTDSFRDWSARLAAYAHSKKLLRETAYWGSLEALDVKPLPKDNNITQRRNSDNGQLEIQLSETETEKLLKRVNLAYNTEVNDILLTALGLAFKNWTGEERVLINLEGHGREDIGKELDISRTVGWFTVQYPVLLDMTGNTDLGYRIKSVKESLRQIPNKGIGYGILKYLTAKEHKAALKFNLRPEIGFNYLGQFDEDKDVENGILSLSDISTGNSISPQMESTHALDINGIVTKGCLTFTLIYNRGEYRAETIAHLAECFREHLVLAIDHCVALEGTEMTPSDFTIKGMTLEGLEDLEVMLSGLE
jgi:non-ribosomal peptide synthase protein (TIGR01720 family)